MQARLGWIPILALACVLLLPSLALAQGQIVGQLQPTGLRPHVLDRLSQYGEHVPIE